MNRNNKYSTNKLILFYAFIAVIWGIIKNNSIGGNTMSIKPHTYRYDVIRSKRTY